MECCLMLLRPPVQHLGDSGLGEPGKEGKHPFQNHIWEFRLRGLCPDSDE